MQTGASASFVFGVCIAKTHIKKQQNRQMQSLYPEIDEFVATICYRKRVKLVVVKSNSETILIQCVNMRGCSASQGTAHKRRSVWVERHFKRRF